MRSDIARGGGGGLLRGVLRRRHRRRVHQRLRPAAPAAARARAAAARHAHAVAGCNTTRAQYTRNTNQKNEREKLTSQQILHSIFNL